MPSSTSELNCCWYFRNIRNFGQGPKSWRDCWKSTALIGRQRHLLTSDIERWKLCYEQNHCDSEALWRQQQADKWLNSAESEQKPVALHLFRGSAGGVLSTFFETLVLYARPNSYHNTTSDTRFNCLFFPAGTRSVIHSAIHHYSLTGTKLYCLVIVPQDSVNNLPIAKVIMQTGS